MLTLSSSENEIVECNHKSDTDLVTLCNDVHYNVKS